MNILLVEDEPIILNFIEKTILSFNGEFNIIDKFYDGQSAYNYIEDNPDKIEVVITDIQIPMLNGLELIGKINKNDPNIICIILTGYDDFKYAQKAVSLNVFSYLLKPLNKEEIHKQLLKAYETKLLNKLNFTPVNNNEEISLEDSEIKYFAAYICAGNYSFLPTSDLNNYDELWENINLNKFLEDKTEINKFWIIDGKTLSEKLILISFNENISKISALAAKKLFSQLLNKEYPLTILISPEVLKLQEVVETTQKMENEISQNIIMFKSQLIMSGDTFIIKENENNEGVIERLEELKILLNKSNFSVFEKMLRDFLDYIIGKNITQLRATEYLTNLLYYCYVLNNKFVKDATCFELINSAIVLSFDKKMLYENVLSLFADTYDKLLTTQDSYYLIIQLDEYINKHYCESINLLKLAKEFSLTPAYLSKIYKEQKQLTPNDQITGLRIDKAKKLLSSNANMKIKDVALYVGYEDPLYFSKVFKKNVGYTPKSYQKMCKIN